MSLTTDISGRVALVTGASSGLGQATAVRLAEAGVHVFALGRSADGLEATRAQIQDAGGRCDTLKSDIGEPGALAAAVDDVVAKAGKINILVNNAAVMFMHGASDSPPDATAQMMQINLLAPIEGAQAAIRHMRASGEPGHIVAISSLASRLPGGGLYGAGKIALEKFMEQLRDELEQDDIRVTTIIPGGFSTNLGRDMTEAQQAAFQKNIGPKMADITPDADGRTPLFGVPDDIARAVVFAVAQPIYLNIFEMVVRPARNIDPAAFRE